jgi:hypothetical protein
VADPSSVGLPIKPIKPIKQQLLSDHAAPPYLWRAVAVHARQANHQHIQRRTADR